MRHLRPLPLLALLLVFFAGCGAESDGQPDACEGVTSVCSADTDCKGQATCGPCGQCLLETCGGDSDCGNGRKCTGGVCTTPGCTSDSACGDGLICVEGACVTDDCTASGCPGGKHCRALDNSCVDCLGDSDCSDPEASYCEIDSGACVGCRSDDDCAGGRCGAGDSCVECLSSADCAAPTPACRVDVGVCGSCATDTDCPGSFCREDATCWPGPEAGEPCNVDGSCAPGLLCAGDVCSTRCDLYAPDCPTGTACELMASEGRALFEGGEPVAACLDTSSGAGVERPCGGDVFCRAGYFCVPTSADGGTCKPYCEPGGGARNCAAGDICVPVSLGTQGEEIGLCSVPTTWLESCSVNADCNTGQGCVPLVEGTAIVGRCQFTEGTGAALAGCVDDSDCRSAFCVAMSDAGDAGFCWGGCTDNLSCGGGFCVNYNFTTSTGMATARGCRPGCDVSSDCGAVYGPDAICTVGVVETELAGICAARQGPAGPGAACVDDDTCATGLCFDNEDIGRPANTGFCLGTCEVDADCGANTSCRTVVLNTATEGAPPALSTIDMCWGADCSRNGDCPAGWACGLDSDPADLGNGLRTSCAPAGGSGPPGQACTADNQCMSDFCATFGAGQVCWGPCVTNADCVAGTTCQAVIFNQTSQQTACLP